MTKTYTSTDGPLASQEKPSYKIRLAKTKDWPMVARMAEEFYEFSPYASVIPFHKDSAKELFHDLVEGTGAIVLATLDEKAVGMIGFLCAPFPINKNIIMGTEMFWWVDPEHRGSIVAKELVVTAEEVAKIMYGASHFTMSKLSNSPKRLGAFYKILGYEEQDVSYMKRL